jgi:hypothetical protein
METTESRCESYRDFKHVVVIVLEVFNDDAQASGLSASAVIPVDPRPGVLLSQVRHFDVVRVCRRGSVDDTSLLEVEIVLNTWYG